MSLFIYFSICETYSTLSIQFRVVAKFPRVDLFFRKQSVDLVFPGSLRSAGQGETAVKAVRADLAHAASWRETSEGPAAGGDGAGERVYAGGAGRERKMGTGHTGHLLSRKSCRWVGTAPGGGPLEYRFSKNKQKKSTAFQKLYSFTPMAQAPALFNSTGKRTQYPLSPFLTHDRIAVTSRTAPAPATGDLLLLTPRITRKR